MVSDQSISTCNLIRKFNLGTKHAALEEVPPIECGLLNRINVKFQRCISPASKKIKKDSRISGFQFVLSLLALDFECISAFCMNCCLGGSPTPNHQSTWSYIITLIIVEF